MSDANAVTNRSGSNRPRSSFAAAPAVTALVRAEQLGAPASPLRVGLDERDVFDLERTDVEGPAGPAPRPPRAGKREGVAERRQSLPPARQILDSELPAVKIQLSRAAV